MIRREHRWVAVLVAGVVAGGMLALGFGGQQSQGSSLNPAAVGVISDGSAPAPAPTGSVPPATDSAAESSVPVAQVRSAVAPIDDAAIADLSGNDACVLVAEKLRGGDTGADVICLQRALAAAGLYTGSPSGQFDAPTDVAVRALQEQRNLFVDGVVGRESAISLGIWPDEQSSVVRTPPPAAGAVDTLGYRLSSVATSGPDAPPLPLNSGSGRRIVYERAGQRVWAVDDNDNVIRSYLVTGSKYSNELPGEHVVYSRSDMSTAWNGKAWLPKMVRWLKTDIGAIGFHAIPKHVEDNTPYQTEAELGTRMSGGCQRQANLDADFMWDFAQIGTPVIVL